jgi:hypothetical protein
MPDELGRGHQRAEMTETETLVALRGGEGQDSRVKSCWTTKGQIKFILHSNVKEIKKVSSLLDSLDTILK